MISNADVADICLGVYRYQGLPQVAFDVFDQGLDDDVCWGLKKVANVCDVVALRGSTTVLDWFLDFMVLPIQTSVGTVHSGFHAGIEKMYSELRPHLSQPVVVTGHSLGAARASVLTALMIVGGAPPLRRVAFGEPRPGFPDHAAIVGTRPGFSYCNGYGGHEDLVTDVPFVLPNLPFTRASALIQVSAPPVATDAWGPLAYHHMELYAAAVHKLLND